MENQSNEKSHILFWMGMLLLNSLPLINLIPLLIIIFKTKTKSIKEFCIASIFLQAILILALIFLAVTAKNIVLSLL